MIYRKDFYMVFTRRKGRPRVTRAAKDSGTPELQSKRKLGLTSEPLDVMLEKGLISECQHKAGMHLRWLYTLKFGLPTIKAADPCREKANASPKKRDEKWQQQREADYHDAVACLRKLKAKQIAFYICVYQQWPYWLVDYLLLGKKELDIIAKKEIQQLKQGLDVIGMFPEKNKAMPQKIGSEV